MRVRSSLLACLLGLAAAGCGGKVLVDGVAGGGGGEGGTTNSCGCASDADCPLGSYCQECMCQSGCISAADCPPEAGCCDGACTDLAADPDNCGACGAVCDLPNASAKCQGFECVIAACDKGSEDCDGIAQNGCESSETKCICAPGTALGCYTGPGLTAGVGVCKTGTMKCLGGIEWGPCEGEVVPSAEICDGLDNDCDGHDDTWDPDGDGITACEGDCCETVACAPNPALVNPGAMEYPGNGLDDDCNPDTADDAPFPDCSGPALAPPTAALDLVKAMDLCVFTQENPKIPKEKTWGVISYALTLADGATSTLPADVQTGVLANYGQMVVPKHGKTMAALSSGTARDEDDPGFVYPQNGYLGGQIGNYVAGTLAAPPMDFVAANGGQVPSPCFACADLCSTAFDSVALSVKIRTPTNADALEVYASFFSAEYPESVCTEYDDFFVALLDSQHPDTPFDKNIALVGPGKAMSVNTADFLSCVQPPTCLGPAELVGTGMGGWDGTLVDGGGTEWSKIQASIVPGETIDLRFAIWDATDGNVDSLVLLDRFRFHVIEAALP